MCLVVKEARGIKTKRSVAVMHTADRASQRTDRPVVVQFGDRRMFQLLTVLHQRWVNQASQRK